MRKRFMAVLWGIFLFGCTSVSERLQPVLAPAANMGDGVPCQSGCKEEWERAQVWIARHSNMKIQLSTDVLIETYNPVNDRLDAGFSKERTDRRWKLYDSHERHLRKFVLWL